ncbi:hypothetical protein [Gordonia alkaliphila]|uniref:hypothetical protein n=1 Tax=Gordonia alkaliphila TaxID=1053547 RepID=UPI0031E72295
MGRAAGAVDAVTVVLVAGVDPEPLASVLRGEPGIGQVRSWAVVPVRPRCDVAVLAVDLTCAVGTVEKQLMARLRGTPTPIALVGVGAGQDRAWPARLAQARAILDPDRRLPVFAVGPDGAGVDAVARWCTSPEPRAREATVPEPEVPEAAAPKAAAEPTATARTERLAGARVGFTELRAQLAGDVRAGAQDLSQRARAASGRLGPRESETFRSWLQTALLAYRDRIDDELAAGVDHIRATALLGVPGIARAPLDRGRSLTPPAPPLDPAPGRRFAAEDAVVLALGASAGLGLGRVSVVPLVQWAGLGAAGTVLTVLAGLAVAAGVVAVRRSGAVRAARAQACAEAVAATRSALEHAVAAGLGTAEAQLTRELWNRTGTPCVQPSRQQ